MQRDVIHSSTDEWLAHLTKEVAVRPGASKAARRLDAVLAVQPDTNRPDELVIHGIEIKVSQVDRDADKKVTESRPFVDARWVAVPPSLADHALELLPAPAGIGVVTLEHPKAELSKRALVVGRSGEMHDPTPAARA